MGNLLNKQIDQSYQGLIKTNDEAAIGATEKRLQDGTGQDLPVEVGTGGMTYYGTQDFTNATVTGIGGGGGTTLGLHNTTRGIVLDNSAVTNSKFMWRTTYNSTSYATATFTVNANTLYATAMSFAEGEIVDKFGVYVRTAGATLRGAIYSAQYDVNGNIEPATLLYDFGQIDTTTTGLKVITGANYTLGSTVDNVYFLCIHCDDAATGTGIMSVGTTNLAGPIYHSSMYATTSYRGNTFHAAVGTSLPADLTPYTFNATANFPQYGVAR